MIKTCLIIPLIVLFQYMIMVVLTSYISIMDKGILFGYTYIYIWINKRQRTKKKDLVIKWFIYFANTHNCFEFHFSFPRVVNGIPETVFHQHLGLLSCFSVPKGYITKWSIWRQPWTSVWEPVTGLLETYCCWWNYQGWFSVCTQPMRDAITL